MAAVVFAPNVNPVDGADVAAPPTPPKPKPPVVPKFIPILSDWFQMSKHDRRYKSDQ